MRRFGLMVMELSIACITSRITVLRDQPAGRSVRIASRGRRRTASAKCSGRVAPDPRSFGTVKSMLTPSPPLP